MDRDQPRLPEFRAPNEEHARLEVDIRSIKMECFIDSKAGDRQQAKQRGIRPPSEVLGGRQRRRALDHADDVLIAIEPRRLPAVPLTDQVGGRHLGAPIGGATPYGEASCDQQSAGPRAGLGVGGLKRPLGSSHSYQTIAASEPN